MNVQGEQHGASGREGFLRGKGEAERYSAPSNSDAKCQKQEFISMCPSADETPSHEERTRNAEQVVATGTKSWKTLRRKGEAVWPPLL